MVDDGQHLREQRQKVNVVRLRGRAFSWLGVGRVVAAPREGEGKSKGEERTFLRPGAVPVPGL